MHKGIFKGNEKRRLSILESLYEKNISHFLNIPNIGLGVLNQILGELFSTEKMPRHNLVLLKQTLTFWVRPVKRVSGKSGCIYEYSIRFLRSLYSVHFGKKGGRKIFRLQLNVKTVQISWQGHFRQQKKVFQLDRVLYCADLTVAKFKTATGMGVKKTSSLGTFKLGGVKVKLGGKNHNKLVLVFFDRGKLFIFDLNGKKIVPISLK
ncbi:MAG: hypothetical protein NTX82_04370 [Candidatus Parcubacteria bacterium]|nr:hypothetical protein [Candidatus Parcubacteria bacterium]